MTQHANSHTHAHRPPWLILTYFTRFAFSILSLLLPSILHSLTHLPFKKIESTFTPLTCPPLKSGLSTLSNDPFHVRTKKKWKVLALKTQLLYHCTKTTHKPHLFTPLPPKSHTSSPHHISTLRPLSLHLFDRNLYTMLAAFVALVHIPLHCVHLFNAIPWPHRTPSNETRDPKKKGVHTWSRTYLIGEQPNSPLAISLIFSLSMCSSNKNNHVARIFEPYIPFTPLHAHSLNFISFSCVFRYPTFPLLYLLPPERRSKKHQIMNEEGSQNQLWDLDDTNANIQPSPNKRCSLPVSAASFLSNAQSFSPSLRCSFWCSIIHFLTYEIRRSRNKKEHRREKKMKSDKRAFISPPPLLLPPSFIVEGPLLPMPCRALGQFLHRKSIISEWSTKIHFFSFSALRYITLSNKRYEKARNKKLEGFLWVEETQALYPFPPSPPPRFLVVEALDSFVPFVSISLLWKK